MGHPVPGGGLAGIRRSAVLGRRPGQLRVHRNRVAAVNRRARALANLCAGNSAVQIKPRPVPEAVAALVGAQRAAPKTATHDPLSKSAAKGFGALCRALRVCTLFGRWAQHAAPLQTAGRRRDESRPCKLKSLRHNSGRAMEFPCARDPNPALRNPGLVPRYSFPATRHPLLVTRFSLLVRFFTATCARLLGWRSKG